MVTHQLQVERRTGKDRRSQTNVLPLYHATNEDDDDGHDDEANDNVKVCNKSSVGNDTCNLLIASFSGEMRSWSGNRWSPKSPLQRRRDAWSIGLQRLTTRLLLRQWHILVVLVFVVIVVDVILYATCKTTLQLNAVGVR